MQGRVAIRPVRVVYGTRSIYHHPDTYRRDTGGRALPGNQKQMVTAGGTIPTVLHLVSLVFMKYGLQPVYRETPGSRAGGANEGRTVRQPTN